MKIFEKTGEKRWKAWIPFYNTFILFKLFWNAKWFWVLIGGYAFIAIFGNIKVGNPLATIFAVLVVIVAIGIFVWRCILAYKIAQKFNKSIAWVIGLIFLSCVFYIILGFGSAEYNETSAKVSSYKPASEKTKKAPTKTTKKPSAKPVAKPVDKTPTKAAKKPTKAAKPTKPKAAAKPSSSKSKPDYINPKEKIQF